MRTAADNVLVVSQQPDLREGLRLALHRLGIPSLVASDAVEAVRMLSEGAPCAIVIDFEFADMDPQQILRRAIACRDTHGIPIVAIGEPQDRDSLLDSGCTALLHRETTPLAIADAVAQLLRSHGAGNTDAGMRLRLQPKKS